jgi:hypothetical protein
MRTVRLRVRIRDVRGRSEDNRVQIMILSSIIIEPRQFIAAIDSNYSRYAASYVNRRLAARYRPYYEKNHQYHASVIHRIC